MQLNVLLFATLKDRAGTNHFTLELPESTSSVARVRDAVTARFPALAPSMPTAVCAVNQEFAEAGDAVKDGDEIAFFPPVSGGVA
jgi:molybdopterin synthase catalytic subunit